MVSSLPIHQDFHQRNSPRGLHSWQSLLSRSICLVLLAELDGVRFLSGTDQSSAMTIRPPLALGSFNFIDKPSGTLTYSETSSTLGKNYPLPFFLRLNCYHVLCTTLSLGADHSYWQEPQVGISSLEPHYPSTHYQTWARELQDSVVFNR